MEILTGFCARIAESGKLTPALKKELREVFGEKAERAIETAQTHRVKKYTFSPSQRVVWVVVGKNRDYQVLPQLFCMCDDFYLSVVIRRTDKACYHLIAQMLAEATGCFDNVESEDEKFQRYMEEWSKPSLGALLEKLKKE